MGRGDLVTVAVSGDSGKPRPALIVQADAFADHATVTVLLLSSALIDAPLLRFTVWPCIRLPHRAHTMSPRRA